MSTHDEDNSLLSNRYEDFRGALEILYIINNLSGRVQFIKNWPDVAQYLFGTELISFDTNGTEDREARFIFEEKAEEKRVKLLETVATLEEKSVVEGALQAEYVESVVKYLGRDLALLLYAPRFVDRTIPPPDSETDSNDTSDSTSNTEQPSLDNSDFSATAQVSSEKLTDIPLSPIEQNIQPISIGEQSSTLDETPADLKIKDGEKAKIIDDGEKP